jgi:hypothetical protein
MPTQEQIKLRKRLRWACRAVVLLATAGSIYSNSLNSNWADWVSVFEDALPPVAMFLSFELATRIPLDPEASWVFRWLIPGAATLIASGSAWFSYWNQLSAFKQHTYGNDWKHTQIAYGLPILIDLTMVVAALKLLDLNRQLQKLENLALIEQVKEERANDPDRPKVTRARKKSTKRDSVVKYLTKYPNLTQAEIAAKAGASLSLVSQTKRDLANARKELVDA